MPKRIQLKRTKGWRIRQAVSVARPTRFGNPFKSADRRVAAQLFAEYLEWRRKPGNDNWVKYPTDEVIRAVLRGKDLACWCPLDQPCHADSLLEAANA
jgi:hypothetical protein